MSQSLQPTSEHPDARAIRAVVRPLGDALERLPERYHEDSFDDLMAVVDEARKLVTTIRNQADELDARWRSAISLEPINPQTMYDALGLSNDD